jgi:hypothetical protein
VVLIEREERETGESGDRERRKMLPTLPPFGCLNYNMSMRLKLILIEIIKITGMYLEFFNVGAL